MQRIALNQHLSETSFCFRRSPPRTTPTFGSSPRHGAAVRGAPTLAAAPRDQRSHDQLGPEESLRLKPAPASSRCRWTPAYPPATRCRRRRRSSAHGLRQRTVAAASALTRATLCCSSASPQGSSGSSPDRVARSDAARPPGHDGADEDSHGISISDRAQSPEATSTPSFAPDAGDRRSRDGQQQRCIAALSRRRAYFPPDGEIR